MPEQGQLRRCPPALNLVYGMVYAANATDAAKQGSAHKAREPKTKLFCTRVVSVERRREMATVAKSTMYNQTFRALAEITSSAQRALRADVMRSVDSENGCRVRVPFGGP